LPIGIINALERQLAQLKQAEPSTPHATILSYFFYQSTNSSLNNTTAILRGLIFLLAIQQPSLNLYLHKEYKHSSHKLFKDSNTFFALSKILSSILQDPSLARAYIIINTLNECKTGLQ
jgi:hypothetical protein